MNKEKIKSYHCQVEAAMDVLGGKYKAIIIYDLIGKTLRYNEIQKLIPQATPRMLSKQLKELINDDIIEKTIYPVVPPKTEYCLTEWGKTLIPIIQGIDKWGQKLFEKEGIDIPC